MQTLYYNTDHYMRHSGNIVDLGEYRRRLALVREEYEGLPPLPRREHRCPLGLRLSDLVSMTMVVTTLAVTGVLLAGM